MPAGVASLAEGAAEVGPGDQRPRRRSRPRWSARAGPGPRWRGWWPATPLYPPDAVVREVLGVAGAGVPFNVRAGRTSRDKYVPTYAGGRRSARRTPSSTPATRSTGPAPPSAPGALVCSTATQAHLGEIAVALLEQGRAGRTPGLGHRGRHRRHPDVGDHDAGRARAGLRLAVRPAGGHGRTSGHRARAVVLVGVVAPAVAAGRCRFPPDQGAGRRDRASGCGRTGRCRSRCRPSRSSRRAPRPRSRRRSRASSPAGTSGSCSPRPTRCAKCGRSSTSSGWTRGPSPA